MCQGAALPADSDALRDISSLQAPVWLAAVDFSNGNSCAVSTAQTVVLFSQAACSQWKVHQGHASTAVCYGAVAAVHVSADLPLMTFML